jgi:hypothetical protein
MQPQRLQGGHHHGIPVKIVEVLALPSHRRIPRKCRQLHMSTCSAHGRVTGYTHSLDGGLKSYCRCLVPQVPRVFGYDPKF